MQHKINIKNKNKMIYVIGGIKGGVGKSTLACQLASLNAANGKNTLLVDADPQQATATRFNENREGSELKNLFTSVQLQDKQLLTQLTKLSKNYDDVVVDVPGKDSVAQRCALVVADVLLTPFPPKDPDLATLHLVADIVEMAMPNNVDLKWFVFRNMAYPNNKDNQSAVKFIKEHEIEEATVLEEKITNRKAFSDAMTEGKGVWEIKKANQKAIDEIKALYSIIFKIEINFNIYENA